MITKDNLEFFFAVLGVLATIPIYMGWFVRLLSWNRQRKIEKLRKQKEFLSHLKSSDREFLGWLLHRLLLVVTIFCAALMFRGIEVYSELKLVASLHWLLGGAAYFFAVSALGIYSRLRNFDKSMQNLNEQIQKLGG